MISSDVNAGPLSLWRRIGAALPHRTRMIVAGDRIAANGNPLDTVVFPLDCIFVLGRQNSYDPQLLASGMVGREGLVGWSCVLGASVWQQEVVAVVGGDAIEVRTDALRAALNEHVALREVLLRYVHNYMLQLTQNTIANLGHSLERRLARWLVMIHDRSDGDELSLTHDTLAMLLNVRRASVTDALHLLEGERLLRGMRGLVTIRDREGLQAAAGYSYGFAENDYRSAIGPFGRASAEQVSRQEPAG